MTPPTPDDFDQAQRDAHGQMVLAGEVVVCMLIVVVALLGYIVHRCL